MYLLKCYVKGVSILDVYVVTTMLQKQLTIKISPSLLLKLFLLADISS